MSFSRKGSSGGGKAASTPPASPALPNLADVLAKAAAKGEDQGTKRRLVFLCTDEACEDTVGLCINMFGAHKVMQDIRFKEQVTPSGLRIPQYLNPLGVTCSLNRISCITL